MKRLIAIAFCASFIGCKDDPQATPDTGVEPMDVGMQVDTSFPSDVGTPVDTGVVDTGVDPDAGEPDMGAPDVGPPPNVEVAVSGRVRMLGEYLAGNIVYVGSAAVLGYGVDPPTQAISEEADLGYYSLTVPANGDVIFFVTKAGYHQTFQKITVADQEVQNQSLPLAEAAWLAEIATAHNVDLATPFACQTPELVGSMCIYTIVVGRIVDDQAQPVAGVYGDDFTVLGPNDSNAWTFRGPYFLGPTGTSSAAAQQSLAEGLYILFAEIPQTGGGSYVNLKLQITYDDNGTNRYFGPVDVQAFRGPNGAVNWANVPETGIVVQPPIAGVDFDTQVYPLFLTVPQGGLGCQGCHSGATPAAGMDLVTPEVAYASLDPATYPMRVNVSDPDASLVLSKPLYEAEGPQNHPIFVFASPTDPGYQIIRTWISEGAQRNVVLPPVSFAAEVHAGMYNDTQNGGWGCRACHYDGVDANTAPGGFYISGDPAAVYDELVNEAPGDNGLTGELYRVNKDPAMTDRSLVLINPLAGNPEPHPVKIFYDNTDPRYALIYRWIQEGYNNN
jgi:hypothetical protein